mgnify:FL=1
MDPGPGFEWRSYQAPAEEEYVCATFAVRMRQSNSRLLEELQHFCPSRAVHVLINDGYRAFPRPLPKQLAMYDLLGAMQILAREALRRGCRTALLCEEDMFWRRDARLSAHMRHVRRFCARDDWDAYFLGGVVAPALRAPQLRRHVRLVKNVFGAHAVIYSTQGLQMLASGRSRAHLDTGASMHMRAFRYHLPLAYQLFPATENQRQSWNPSLVVIKNLLGMDKRAEPWYSLSYLADAWLLTLLVLVAALLARAVQNRAGAPIFLAP